METPASKTYYGYALVHQVDKDAEPTTSLFKADDYCHARESYLKQHEEDTHIRRKGHFTTSYFPCTELYFVQYDEARQETERHKLIGNRHQSHPLGRPEPLALTLLLQRQNGMAWFVQDDDEQRHFFSLESDALKFMQQHTDTAWQLFNLDKHLDHMEGKSIQHFLIQRSALSTNQLEILADLGRGTLSKIKNGQRVLSRKQYGRIVRVLQHYGYAAWVDLRQLEAA